MRFVIPAELPDLNAIIAAAKSHYAAYNNLKRTNTELVVWSAKNLSRVGRIHITCHWYSKDRRKDPDNVAAGIKFILDGLVEAGVLQNDGHQQIASITHLFEVDKRQPRVEIEIEEVGA